MKSPFTEYEWGGGKVEEIYKYLTENLSTNIAKLWVVL